MSEDSTGEETRVISDESPVATAYEPNFRRFFARGTLVQVEEYDDNVAQLSFWSKRERDIDVEGVSNVAGYRIEADVVMDWDSIRDLRDTLDTAIREQSSESEQDGEQ